MILYYLEIMIQYMTIVLHFIFFQHHLQHLRMQQALWHIRSFAMAPCQCHPSTRCCIQGCFHGRRFQVQPLPVWRKQLQRFRQQQWWLRRSKAR